MIIKKEAYQEPPFHQGTNTQENSNINNEIRKARIVNNDDYKELIRFLDGVQVLVINNRYELAIDMLEHKKKVLKKKIQEAK